MNNIGNISHLHLYIYIIYSINDLFNKILSCGEIIVKFTVYFASISIPVYL